MYQPINPHKLTNLIIFITLNKFNTQKYNVQTPNVNRLRIINLICLLAYFILFITTAIVNYLTNLYLAIFIASIVFCFINLAYLFAPNLQQKIAAKRFVMVYIPGGIIGPTAIQLKIFTYIQLQFGLYILLKLFNLWIVNFFIRFINWMTNFNYYKQIIGYIVCELFFLLSVFMFSTVFVMYLYFNFLIKNNFLNFLIMYVRKTAPVNQ